MEKTESNAVFGRNAVMELLRGEIKPERIYLKSGDREGSIKVIEALARKSGVPVIDTSLSKLDSMSGGGNHQGVVALCCEKECCSVEDILKIAEERGEKPFVVVADGIEDPHNLGALIRSAECAGVHGIIIPKRRSCPITSTVAKSSAGALTHMAIAKVSNLASAVEKLKESGLWVFAAEAGGTPYNELDTNCPVCLVLGSEGSGVSHLLKEKSDYIISIPMYGKITSLNVSAAGAILMFSVANNQRKTNINL